MLTVTRFMVLSQFKVVLFTWLVFTAGQSYELGQQVRVTQYTCVLFLKYLQAQSVNVWEYLASFLCY